MSIMITGATGQLGRLVIAELVRNVGASSIVACVRQPDKAAELKEQGIEVRYADYDQPESLAEAFAGASRLLLVSSSHQDDTVRVRQHAHAVEAAKQAKVGHLLYTGFAFAEKSSVPLAHLHLATEHAIRTTGIPFTFLRNALYIDFLAPLGLEQAIASGELITPPGEWRFNSVTRNELAVGIAAVLTQEGHEHATYELTASRTWDFQELAQALTELAGRPVVHREDPRIQHWLYPFLTRVDTASTAPELEALIGRPAASLKESVAQLLDIRPSMEK